MATYLLLAKFSPDGAKGIQKEGFVFRRQMADKAIGAIGGRVLGYYACGDAEWDVVNLFETPEGSPAAMGKTTASLTASGAFSHLRLLPLATAEEYDAVDVEAATQTYKAPGQS